MRLHSPLIAAIIAAASIITTSCNREGSGTASAKTEAPQYIRTITAVTGDVPLEIAAIGNVEAISTVDVKARVTAPVLRVNFAEGQDVRKGDLLFELDPETFKRQLAEAEASIARDAANAKQAEANFNRDQATWKNLGAIAGRASKLHQEGIFSREQADQSLANAEAAKSAVDSDRAAMESAKAAEDVDRAKLMEIRLLLDYTKIYAPISGRAGTIAIKQGSLAKQDDNTLVTLLQSSPVYVSFAIPENILPEVRKYQAGSPLPVSAIAAGKRISSGVLRFIDNSVDSTTGTIKLKAQFPNSDRVLWPGQFVNIRARLNMEQNRILIAAQAVQTGPKGKFVWVYNPSDSKVAIRDVVVTRNYTPAAGVEQAVVESGLKAGDVVVSEGQKRLAPNAPVRLLQAGSNTPSS